MQTVEVKHHTREQVEGYLREAGEIVDESNLPADLRGIAFTKAVELLASKTVQAVVHPSGLLTPGLPH